MLLFIRLSFVYDLKYVTTVKYVMRTGEGFQQRSTDAGSGARNPWRGVVLQLPASKRQCGNVRYGRDAAICREIFLSNSGHVQRDVYKI
jgi:hypothetical protein